MPLTYSRDAAAHPLMILKKLNEEIRKGIFKPDEGVAGRASAWNTAGDSGQEVKVKGVHNGDSRVTTRLI